MTNPIRAFSDGSIEYQGDQVAPDHDCADYIGVQAVTCPVCKCSHPRESVTVYVSASTTSAFCEACQRFVPAQS